MSKVSKFSRLVRVPIGNTIHEVLEYGEVVFVSPNGCDMITCNPSYLNWWSKLTGGRHNNTAAKPTSDVLKPDCTERQKAQAAFDWYWEVMKDG